MIIKTIKISLETKIKVYNKHGITMEEIKKTFLEGKPYFARTKDGRYFSVGKFNRHVTVIFSHNKFNESEIITAYPSSDWQIKLYKRKK